jgi:YfiH family protein
MIQMQQVHGSSVIRVSKKDDGKTIENCDGLISNDPNLTLSVRVADCLPISLIDKKSHSFGIIHAGWRGLDKKILTNAVKEMINEFSVDPKDLEVKIGPHICQKHYEVGSDVSSKFVSIVGAILQKNGKEYLDLGKIAEFELIQNGVKRENIEISKTCTFENINLASYRRGDKTRRNIYTVTA